MIINDLDSYYIVFDTKNRNMELDTLINRLAQCLFLEHFSFKTYQSCFLNHLALNSVAEFWNNSFFVDIE